MDRHPLLMPIRMLIVTAIVLAMSPWHPEIGMTLLATGFGWWKGCGCCAGGGGCLFCSPESDASKDWEVTIAGVGNATTCTGCSCLNDTYILDFVSGNISNCCVWEFDIPACGISCTGYDSEITHTLYLHFCGLQIDCGIDTLCCDGADCGFLQWSKGYGATPDCDSFSGEVLNVVTGFNSCNSDPVTSCSQTGGSATITPI